MSGRLRGLLPLARLPGDAAGREGGEAVSRRLGVPEATPLLVLELAHLRKVGRPHRGRVSLVLGRYA